MSNFNVEMNYDAVMEQNNSVKQPIVQKKNTYDPKNYLNTRLSDGETSRTITIRLLPFDASCGTPFKQIHMHTIRVNKEVAPGGWKTLPCPEHNEGDVEKKTCPICQFVEELKHQRMIALDAPIKEKYQQVERDCRVKPMWIVRCIERGHEDDGVKFWLFNSSRKGDGVYDKIINIAKQRMEKAKSQGKTNNIFDLNEGKDLLITITKDTNGKTVYNITDDDEKTPLSDDFNLAMSWITDQKKWTEVYTVKPNDYMDILVKGGIPKFDKEKMCYIDGSETESDENLEANAEKSSIDYGANTGSTEVVGSVSFGDDEDDLPF